MSRRSRELGGGLALALLVLVAWAVLSGATGAPGSPGAPGAPAAPGATGAPGRLGAAASAGADSSSPAAGTAVTSDIARGETLYLQSCASCHGQQGVGTASGPAIANAGTALVDFVLRTGRMPLSAPNAPVVRKPPSFDDASIRALVAYVGSLGTGPAIPDVAVSGADLSEGRDLFVQNCAACHGAGGAGGVVGSGWFAPSLDQADPRTVGEAAVSGPGPMPVFSFTPDQLDALAAYVQYLRNPASPGGLDVAQVGPVAEGFLAGTIGIVTLLVVARWTARGREHEPDAADAGAGVGAGAADTEPVGGPGGEQA